MNGRTDYFEDEFRFGTRTALGKRWTAKGVRPVGRMNIGYEYGYLYAAVNPLSGRAFGLILPSMTVESMTVFAREFRRWLKSNGEVEAATVLVLDGAGAHSERARQLRQSGKAVAAAVFTGVESGRAIFSGSKA